MRKYSVFVVLLVVILLGVGGVWYIHGRSTDMRGLTYLHYTPLPDDKIICIYFDDGWKSQLNAVPYLDMYGYKVTLAIVANYAASQYPDYMTWSQIRSLSDKGFDIQCHSISHKDLTKMSQSELQSEIVDVKQIFKSQGYSVSTFVYPLGNGYDNATVRQLVESNYSNARTISELTNENTWNLTQDRYAISGFVLTNTTSFQEFTPLVNQAKGTTVVVLVYHEFDTGREYSVTSQLFSQEMSYLYNNGFKVKLLNEII
jgi:hypothetical protein